MKFSLKIRFSMLFFYNNLSVTHVFIKQIFRAVEQALPFPLPPQCRGWGSTGCLNPMAAALVMVLKQWGLGLI
jgi:hypothetical protein